MGAIDTEKVAQERYRLMAEKQVADILGITPAEVRRVVATEMRFNNTRKLVEAIQAKLQVDDVLVTNWITVTDNNYRKALNAFAIWNTQIANDPAINPEAKAKQVLLEGVQAENRKLHAAFKRVESRLNSFEQEVKG